MGPARDIHSLIIDFFWNQLNDDDEDDDQEGPASPATILPTSPLPPISLVIWYIQSRIVIGIDRGQRIGGLGCVRGEGSSRKLSNKMHSAIINGKQMGYCMGFYYIHG